MIQSLQDPLIELSKPIRPTFKAGHGRVLAEACGEHGYGDNESNAQHNLTIQIRALIYDAAAKRLDATKAHLVRFMVTARSWRDVKEYLSSFPRGARA